MALRLGGLSSREGNSLEKKKRQLWAVSKHSSSGLGAYVHMPDEGHLSRVSRVSHVGIDSCT